MTEEELDELRRSAFAIAHRSRPLRQSGQRQPGGTLA
jgi:hypothetical protein